MILSVQSKDWSIHPLKILYIFDYSTYKTFINIMKKVNCFFFIILSSILLSTSILAQKVDTIEVYSESMDKNIKNVVILPANYDKQKKYPVIYLLHGYGGKYSSWSNIKPTLPQEVSKYDLIVVCPDGQNSWYWDSPVDPKFKFDTYVSKELVEYIDKNFSTIASPKGRAVTGLSMGGHGGLWLGISHPNIYGACGSMSGGVDIRPFPNSWEISKRLGKYKDNKAVWDQYTVINLLDKIEPSSLAIIIDCGYGDFFFQVNEALHKEMLYRNIEHDYLTRPGIHNNAYWHDAIDFQLIFFSNFFNKK